MIEKLKRQICQTKNQRRRSSGVSSGVAAHSAGPKTVKRCCGRVVEILYTQILVAIAASVLFSIYRSSQVLLPTTVDNVPVKYARSAEAQLREEALQKLALEAAEFENDDEFSGGKKQNSNKDEDNEDGDLNIIPRQQNNGNGNGYITTIRGSAPQKPNHAEYSGLLVQPGDFIYSKLPGESAPIVLEEFKLIFFAQAKVGCTVWKMLFRRMMGMEGWRDLREGLPHVRAINGLRYLDHYNISYASHIMSSPDWTRAIFVRDPKERFLSSYLDKAVESNLFVDTCCNRKRQSHCNPAPPAMWEFLRAIKSCPDSHWDPQSKRMEEKYWKYINFVGHLETVQEDSKRLLKRLNAWEQFGITGWGEDEESAIFDSPDGTFHARNANAKMKEYLYPELERNLENFYQEDYKHKLFNFTNYNKLNIDGAVNAPVDHSKLNLPLVGPQDWIYRTSKLQGEASPIVVEKYKLIFFAVPYAAEHEFKRLFRRMMGLEDWKTRKYDRKDPDAINEGLVYLRDYNLTRASQIMTDRTWTRAMFVRDPKERFTMAYTQTAVRSRALLHRICCTVVPRLFCLEGKGTRALLNVPNSTEFLKGIHICKSTHWDPITERMSAMRRLGIHVLQKRAMDKNYFVKNKYWKYINFVGNMDTAYQDARTLLENRLGVWREFGESGWADTVEEEKSQHDSFFTTSSFLKQELKTKTQVKVVIVSPQMETSIESLYRKDYENPLFNLTKKVLFASSGMTFLQEAQDMKEKMRVVREETSKKANVREW